MPPQTIPRCSSAFARSSSPSTNLTLVLMPPSCGMSFQSGGCLSQMIVAGTPAPVAVKEIRQPVVVSSPTPPSVVAQTKVRSFVDSEAPTGTVPQIPAAVSPMKPRNSKRRLPDRKPAASSHQSANASTRPDDAADEEAISASAAGSGVSAVALLSSRGRQPRTSLSLSAILDGTLRRSKSMGAAASRPAPLSCDRSRSLRRADARSPKALDDMSKSVPSASTTTATAAVTPVAAPRRSTLVPSADSASTSPPVAPAANSKPQAIKKYVVQANAYHSTFVQTMMMSRGPEWKPTLRCTQSLTANDIAQCEFVWFKFEFIKSLPHIERQRVSASVLEALKVRTAEYRALWNEGTVEWPNRSGHDLLKALDLLNAYVMPEEPEEAVPSTPLTNVQRKRLPGMLICQKSVAHVVGTPPTGTPDGAVKFFVELKPLLHYHHVSFTKGTPIVACFKDASAVWRKHLLYRYMKQFCDNDPDTRGSVRERMPATYEYNLNDPEAADGARTFMTTLMREAGVVRWLAKATGGANGNGFYVTKDVDDMVRYVGGQSCKGQEDADYWIIQEFVERMPLLFGGHRFHMKVHVVMIGSPVGVDIYAYKKQRIQCCSEVFDPDVMAPLSYIGNWGQQRFATNLVQEKFSTLLEDVKGEYPKLIPAFHRAKQIISEAIEAAWRCGRQHFYFEPGCYELMGWDFVMEACPDGEWRPLLVEANHRPGFGSERKYMEKLIHEVLELVMYPINGLTKYVKETHNGVVEAIWDHVKTIVIDPMRASAECGALV